MILLWGRNHYRSGSVYCGATPCTFRQWHTKRLVTTPRRQWRRVIVTQVYDGSSARVTTTAIFCKDLLR